jgi:2,3-bisphosphoglycerate-independent phosphoglycerate mutase
MKYVILIGDGMSDNKIASLGKKTPLEYASTPNLDKLAGAGRFGLFASVPKGFQPGSDVANLSIFGYAPEKYFTGRAPLEAASIGVKLAPKDVAFRCNLVTIADSDGTTIMDDYSAGHISTPEAAEIIKTLDSELEAYGVRFYPGTSYRHLMVWQDAPPGAKDVQTTPPHDISDKPVEGSLPEGASGSGADKLNELMEASKDILKSHPVNRKRIAFNRKPASSIWLWGQGVKPSIPTFHERFGVEGSIISAVDLMKGIGIYAGLKVINVPGATGYIDTNYKGKAEYALNSLLENDFVCVHVEAPDEAGHQGSLKDKLRAIEDFDKEIVGRVLEGLKKFGEYTVLALNDHPTPVELKTHTSDPVPFALCTSKDLEKGKKSANFSEIKAGKTGLFVEDCKAFMEEFFGRPEITKTPQTT